MNAPERKVPIRVEGQEPAHSPALAALAFAHLAPAVVDEGVAEAKWLSRQRVGVHKMHASHMPDLARSVKAWYDAPPPADAKLHQLSRALALSSAELLALALALSADTDLMAGRALAWLQAPHRDNHPTAGLVASLNAAFGCSTAQSMAALLDGIAVSSGLLQVESRHRALPDVVLRVPLPLVLSLSGGDGNWAGVSLDNSHLPNLPASLCAEAQVHAEAFGKGMAALVVRSGHPMEARVAAEKIATALGARAAFIEADVIAPASATPSAYTLCGLGPWLVLHKAVPVFCVELAPGERRKLPALVGYRGPRLVASGQDGTWELAGDTVAAWRVPVPCAAERSALWQAAGSDAVLALQLGQSHRHASARIHVLAQAAQVQRLLSGQKQLTATHVVRAARSASCGDLGSLAQALPEDVFDNALVLPNALRSELETLCARCLARDGLADQLGPAARARYRPGVRALMVGPSGTGKTLSAGWLATRLGLPLYRVDLASVTSKYIGETEKNLGELFARAEHAEVVLLFDEADALFGKRTEVKDANDRFANQQTNYLLQRIEAFDGIVILTSNSRSRFDAAFTRRLDAILDFPAPGPDERRALWLAHLGYAHVLSVNELNRLAAGCDLAGGHIRNVTLAAKAVAGYGLIAAAHLAPALSAEYRKLGKQMPMGLFNDVGPG